MNVNWINQTKEEANNLFKAYRKDYSSRFISKVYPFSKIPKSLWLAFIDRIKISKDTRWSSLSTNQANVLSELLVNHFISVVGKGPFGEEFVTAGGVDLKELDFKRMESKVCKGLYFAGEVVDIDGVTGGFNFQHCWTSGWIAGKSIALELNKSSY